MAACALLLVGVTSITAQASRSCNISVGDLTDAQVWGSANVNSAAYSYGGGLLGKPRDAATGGSFKLVNSKGKEKVNKKLKRGAYTVPNTTKDAGKAEKKGLTLTVSVENKSKSATIKY